jgi:hypothetical protein
MMAAVAIIITILIIHLLGLAPAGYLTTPDKARRAYCGVVLVKCEPVSSLCH